MPVLTIIDTEKQRQIRVEKGANLRQVLLAHDISPYTRWTQKLNCGGNGICATCGVWIHEHIQPTHWHDKAADRFGYPRLSCQIRIVEDLTIELVDKIIWGKRQSSR